MPNRSAQSKRTGEGRSYVKELGLDFGLRFDGIVHLVQRVRHADFVSARENRPLRRHARCGRLRHRLSPERIRLLYPQRLLCGASGCGTRTVLRGARWRMPVSL